MVESPHENSRCSELFVSDVRKAFANPPLPTLEVLKGASFTATPGSMIAIMGASGAGKSTLLHLLGGLDTVDSGQIRLGEFDIANATSSAIQRFRARDVGFVFQSHRLLPDFTASENVAIPLRINRAPGKEISVRVDEQIDQLHLTERAHHPIGHLSGGEQQRVALARALVTRPRLVLADEPTGNLDTAIGDEIIGVLCSFCREQNSVVVIATHSARVAEACNRRFRLEDGKLSSLEI